MKGDYKIIKRAKKKFMFLDSYQICAYRNLEVILEIYQSNVNKV